MLLSSSPAVMRPPPPPLPIGLRSIAAYVDEGVAHVERFVPFVGSLLAVPQPVLVLGCTLVYPGVVSHHLGQDSGPGAQCSGGTAFRCGAIFVWWSRRTPCGNGRAINDDKPVSEQPRSWHAVLFGTPCRGGRRVPH